MSGPFKRRPSLKSLPAISIPPDAIRKASIRRASAVAFKPSPTTSSIHQEVPWDILDRCLMPVLFCHAGAVLISNALSVLQIWDVTTFTLFIWFTIVTIGLVMFYHNLKVRLFHIISNSLNSLNSHPSQLISRYATTCDPPKLLINSFRFAIVYACINIVFVGLTSQFEPSSRNAEIWWEYMHTFYRKERIENKHWTSAQRNR